MEEDIEEFNVDSNRTIFYLHGELSPSFLLTSDEKSLLIKIAAYLQNKWFTKQDIISIKTLVEDNGWKLVAVPEDTQYVDAYARVYDTNIEQSYAESQGRYTLY